MALHIAQYYFGPASGCGFSEDAFGMPTDIDRLSVGDAITIGGAPHHRRIVHILADGGDFALVGPDGAKEIFKHGSPEVRRLAGGTLITCAAAD